MKTARTLKTLVLAFALAAMVAFAGCSTPQPVAGTAAEHSVSVSAESDVKVVPDKARFTVGVTTQAKTAEACQEDNATTVNAVIDALKAEGVAEKSIQTSYSDLSPVYDYDSPTPVASAGDGVDVETEDFSTVKGYEMSTSLTVSDLEIAQVGGIMQAAIAQGATDANGVQYYSSTYDAAYADALRKAIGAAHDKAQVIADASGVHLGSVTSVSEGYQDTSYRYKNDAMAMESAEADGVAMQTMPGEIAVTAHVDVTFALE